LAQAVLTEVNDAPARARECRFSRQEAKMTRHAPKAGANSEGEGNASASASPVWLWSALTSPQAAVGYIEATRSGIDAWRGLIDAYRTAMRGQQDAILDAIEKQAPSSTRAAPADTASGAAFLAPVLAATRVYARLSGAMLSAQREALSAFVLRGKPASGA
jgi:hypothetical protein